MAVDHPPEATPLNAPGPFYVGRDECISCGAPEAEAPSLMSIDEARGSCYFMRQPVTPDETEQAVRAVRVSCIQAVRYAGDDPEIIRRLVEGGQRQYRWRLRSWWQFWKR